VPTTKDFFFSSQPVNFFSKLKRQGVRSQEAENSRIQEFASVEHALLGSNQRISPDFPAVLAVSVAAHRLSSASGRERKL